MTKVREILRLDALGLSGRTISASLECSRKTVADVLGRSIAKGIKWPVPLDMDDIALEKLLFPEKAEGSKRKLPDMDHLHKEMSRNGVTLSLLWQEYCFNCKANSEIPLGYTQFCHHYRQYVSTTKATMHIDHKPGEHMEVDWAGQTASIVDRVTGEIIPVYVFVSVLPNSGYAYVEGFLSRNQESWITAHVNAFNFFEGVAKIIVPDNLRTGVEKTDWYSPTINKSYHEMAEHYGCAIVPARVKKPKDKPSVEGAVGVISTWIIAALRNKKCFSLHEINRGIFEKLKEYNERPFQKKEGSRLSVFIDEEKAMLLPLPSADYELAVWKKATVQFNYHIPIEKMWYSVPYEYIKQVVDIRITSSSIEIFYGNLRICSHPRLQGKEGQYHTIPEHMPEKHKSYSEWNGERFIKWAISIGENTKMVVMSILNYHKVEQQGYRTCMGLLKLADRYGMKRLEAACAKALSYTPNPSYKNVDSILKSGQDKLIPPKEETPRNSVENQGFVRGANYYGGKK
jgi:Transposase and inactivated derivatives